MRVMIFKNPGGIGRRAFNVDLISDVGVVPKDDGTDGALIAVNGHMVQGDFDVVVGAMPGIKESGTVIDYT